MERKVNFRLQDQDLMIGQIMVANFVKLDEVEEGQSQNPIVIVPNHCEEQTSFSQLLPREAFEKEFKSYEDAALYTIKEMKCALQDMGLIGALVA